MRSRMRQQVLRGTVTPRVWAALGAMVSEQTAD